MIDSMIAVIAAAAQAASVPPALLLAICTVESNLNPLAVNVHDGGSASYGLCQIKTETAEWLGKDGSPEELLDPETNASIAALYLSKNLKRYRENESCAIAAYNAGTCRFNNKGLIRNRKYVNKVEKHRSIYVQILKANNRRPSPHGNKRHST